MIPLRTALVASCLLASSSFADDTVIPLWPEGVPGARSDVPPEQEDERGWLTHISNPRMRVYPAPADKANGTAVVVCPGGGYYGQSRKNEGEAYALWLNSLGVTAFELAYRVKDFGHPAPLQDVLRAIRLVRSRAGEFHVAPDRIGVMGSSAGGHLAATAGTLYDHAAGKTGAAIDATSARPDFLILMYPVITLDDPVAHTGSREALLGSTPSPELLRLMSPEKQVTERTPPTLLIHTQDDDSVPVQNSLLFFEALTRAHVPADLYVFEHGPHGMGMRQDLGRASDWPKRAEEWLRGRGLLEPPVR